MTYYESAEGVEICRARATKELVCHGIPEDEQAEFFTDCGDKENYAAQVVLAWLGY